MDNLIGKKIGQYRIEAFVGKGKTGSVYRAQDLNLNRYVALKILSPELAIHPGVQQQVTQAARTVSPLTHPSIVALYNVGAQDGRAFLILDYIQGFSLDMALERLRKRKQFMPIDEALHIIAHAADALGAAHQEGTLHLNLKPSNILVKRREQVPRAGESSLRGMLTDFGLSLIPETGIQTAFIDLTGNFPYMSPEQCTNTIIDGRSDIYSLGIILYQMLSGRLPFNVNSSTEAIMRHSVESPLPLRDIRPNIHPNIAKIVQKAMAKDPTNRYQLAEHMADALRQGVRLLNSEKNTQSTRVLSAVEKQKRQARRQAQAARTDRVTTPGNQQTAVPGTAPLPQTEEPPTPPRPAPIPTRPKPAFNPANIAFSETMSVQPEFETPVFGVENNAANKVEPRQTETKRDPAAKPPPYPPEKPEWLDIPEFDLPEVQLPVTPPPLSSQPRPSAQKPAPPPQSAAQVIDEPPTEVDLHRAPEIQDEIVIIRQGRRPRREQITKPAIRIGRNKDNDIILNSNDVSRYHAKMEWQDGRWLITDLDSSGGTFGSGRRLAANLPDAWDSDKIIQIGPYFFHWADSEDLPDHQHSAINEEPVTELFQIPEDASQVQSTQGRFSVAMHPALITMMAGEQNTVQIELFNQGPVTDTIKLAISGLPAGTYSLTQHFVTLAPGARAKVPLVIQLPASGTLMSYRIAAGNYPFEVMVHSKTAEGETAVIAGMMMVNTIEKFSMGIWPSHVDDGDNIRILIRNEGNVPNSYSLIGRDEKGLVQFGGQRGRLQLKPGEAMTQVVTVRTRERPFFGGIHEIPFEVEIRTENGVQDAKTGHVKVKAQIPNWVVVISTIFFTLLLTVLIITAVINQGEDQVNTPAPSDITPASLPISENVSSGDSYSP